MARRAFYSFNYKPDNWRASQVRNMGVIEGNKPATDNEWETITKGGDAAIKKWIDGQLDGKTVAIVLIGAETAGRPWINYEIKKAWEDKKGVLGVYIHHLKNSNGYQSTKGGNPFDEFTLNNISLSSIVKAYEPPYTASADVYDYIRTNLAGWIEKSIEIRGNYA